MKVMIDELEVLWPYPYIYPEQVRTRIKFPAFDLFGPITDCVGGSHAVCVYVSNQTNAGRITRRSVCAGNAHRNG